MAEEAKPATAKEPERVATKGAIYSAVICLIVGALFLYFEVGQIELMLKEGFKTLGHVVVFALAMLLDFLFLAILALAVFFNIISRAARSYQKGSFLLRIDEFLDSNLLWFGGGLWFLRLVLQIWVSSMFI